MTAIAKPVIAGNWKMNLGPTEARAFAERFLALDPRLDGQTVILFPPALSVAAVRGALGERGGEVALGVQNVHWQESGAFTGELSAGMAADAGADFALVGHSERRHLFGETVEDTVRKVRAALDAGVMPVLCVGETIDERRAGRQEQVVGAQLEPVLATLKADEAARLLIAYEPVWAIGTGETASPADAATMHRAVRERLAARFGEERATGISILYGGSVKPDNAAELLAQPNVDGVLVGGASLDPAGFVAICAASA